MTVIPVDFDQLQADRTGIAPILLANRTLHTSPVTGDAFTGFDAVSRAQVLARVDNVRGNNERSLAVTVEGRAADEDEWAAVDGCEFEFTSGGNARVTIEGPPDQLRVVCTPNEHMTGGRLTFVKIALIFRNNDRLPGDLRILSGDGAPVDYTDGTPPATGEAYAETGSEYTDRATGNKYVNTGTKAQPTWSLLAFD